MEFKVDPEFKSLIPPATAEELAGLEASVAAEGVRDALVVWTEGGILLDGHNRLAIAVRLTKTYTTVGLSFPDRNSAMVWVILNQFNRRNLAPYQRAELVLRLKDVYAAMAKSRQGTRTDLHPNIPQIAGGSSRQGETDRQLAKLGGLSHDTVHKAGVIAKAPGIEESRADLRSRKTTINKVYNEIREKEREAAREAKLQAEMAASRAQIEATRPPRPAPASTAPVPTPAAYEPIVCPTVPIVERSRWSRFLGQQAPDSVDLVLTAAPGLIDLRDEDAYKALALAWVPKSIALLRRTGRAYIFVNSYPAELRYYLLACRRLEEAQLIGGHELLAWTYGNLPTGPARADYRRNWDVVFHIWMPFAPTLRASRDSDLLAVQECDAPDARNPRLKPAQLAERLIRHSTEEGATVIDPFCGTGTFVLAAAGLGRTAIGADSSEEAIKKAVANGCFERQEDSK